MIAAIISLLADVDDISTPSREVKIDENVLGRCFIPTPSIVTKTSCSSVAEYAIEECPARLRTGDSSPTKAVASQRPRRGHDHESID